MTGRFVLLALAMLLAGCPATVPVKTEVVTVEVPVKVPCIDRVPDAPVYRFGVGPAPTEKEMAALLAADFEASEKYGRAWEAAAAGCIKQQPGSLLTPSTPR